MYNKGFIKTWRKEINSDIWLMPPLYHRVWSFLLVYVEWKPVVFPTAKGFGIHVNPGQKITSLNDIARKVSWTEYGVEKTPNRKTIKCILDWLAANGMIELESNRYGTYLNICNWCKYQLQQDEVVTPDGRCAGLSTGHINKKSTFGTKEVKKKEAPPPQQELLKLYHSHCYKLPKVLKMTPARKTALTSRWIGDKERQNLKWWEKFFQRVGESQFLTGNNDRGWKADFSWILKQENFYKILEGKYDNNNGQPSQQEILEQIKRAEDKLNGKFENTAAKP